MKKGLTLLEILVSTVILVMVISGLVSLFVTGKKYVAHSRSRMTAGELGKYYMDPLQQLVRQDTWDANCLGASSGAACPGYGVQHSVDNTVNYIINFTVDNSVPNMNTMRKVTLNLTWDED
jgi:Tfp pilus assembly protein PilV